MTEINSSSRREGMRHEQKIKVFKTEFFNSQVKKCFFVELKLRFFIRLDEKKSFFSLSLSPTLDSSGSGSCVRAAKTKKRKPKNRYLEAQLGSAKSSASASVSASASASASTSTSTSTSTCRFRSVSL